MALTKVFVSPFEIMISLKGCGEGNKANYAALYRHSPPSILIYL